MNAKLVAARMVWVIVFFDATGDKVVSDAIDAYAVI
jgi:hypothetical protein